MNGKLIFEADDPTGGNGHKLWVSDGTAAGTVPLAATPAAGFSLEGAVVAGNELFFAGNDGVHGYELWESDGTEAGTVMVKDINPGIGDGIPNEFLQGMAFGSKVVFAANGGTNGFAGTWVSDGTEAGTMELAANVVPLTGAILNGTLYFANEAQTNQDSSFWKTDGTPGGTVQIPTTLPPESAMVAYNGALLFDSFGNFAPYQALYRSDGTAAGTVDLADGGMQFISPTLVGGVVLFTSDSEVFGQELFKTDGTAAGTGLVKDINPIVQGGGGFPPSPLGSFPADFTVVNGRLFFTAADGTHGREIWSSDGTEMGTFLAQDVNPGSGGSQPYNPINPSTTTVDSELIALGNTLLFAANDGVHGLELWSSAGDQAPVASATPLTQTVSEATPAVFDASASYDPDGDALTYLWDFNGDGVFDASGAQVSHAFGAAGVYPITLKVLDGFGLSSTTTVDVTVTEVEPTAIITNDTPLATDASGNWTWPEGSPIYLSGSITDPGWLDLLSGVTYTWNVTKNGAAYQSGTGQQYWFTPDEIGTYVVTFDVTDEDGSGSVSETIDVTSALTAHIRTPAGLTAETAWALDPNFGIGGQLSTEVTGYNIGGNVLAQQPDGKIVSAGYVYVSPDVYYLAIARYLPDGTPDPSFGQHGVVVTDLGHDDTNVNSPSVLLVQPDGKILIDVTSNYGMSLLRLNPDGTLDTTFGPANTGIVDLPLSFQPTSVVLQGDNVLVGGNGDGNSLVVDRFTAAGTLDPTFGTDGTATVQIQQVTPPQFEYFSGLTAMAVQGGQIYLAGSLVAPSDFGIYRDFFAVVRLDATGNLDTSYGGAAPPDPNGQSWNTYNRLATPGWAFAGDVSFDEDYPTAILVQSDGQALLDGSYGLYQISADGLTGTQVGSGVRNTIAQPDGKQLLASISYDPTSGSTLTLTRLNPDLTPDTTFGPNGDGQVITNLDIDPSIDPSFDSILVQGDGSVVVAMDLYDLNNNYLGSSLTRVLGQATPGQIVHEGDTVTLTGTAFDPAAAEEPTLAYAWTVTKDGAAYQTATGTTYQFTPNDNGTYVVTLTVTDQGGGSSTDSRTFTVVNVPPTAGVAGPATAVAGQVLSYTLSATDPSPVDQAAGFTYMVDWGDGTSGTPDVQTFAASPGNGAGLSVTHAYAAAGTYTVLVTATDKDGGVSTAVSTTVQVNAATATNLQQVVSPSNPVTIQVNSVADATAVVQAINDLTSQSTTVSGTVSLDLAPITYGGLTVSVPDGMTLVIGTASYTQGQQATIDPDSPAFTVTSGNVIVNNVKFVTTGDAPTILVTGGSLTLRNDTIEESTGYSDAAIEVTGGTVDLGSAASPGGNTLSINGSGSFVQNATSTPVPAAGSAFLVNGVALAPDSLSGIVFKDFNDDGQVDFGEQGIAGVAVALTGTDFLGNAVSMSATTDSDGAYIFANLQPGTYSITETQPAGYTQGIDTVGTAGGSLTATDQFFVSLAQDAFDLNGLNYNFGEQPQATGSVQKGQTAGIGFWNNKNGQALINSFNGGPISTQLAAWLAATLPHIFRVDAGSNALIHADGSYFTNAEVAARFQQDFVLKGVKLDAQVLATALSVYATNATLDDTGVAATYGFLVSGDGVGTSGVNVGSNGDAFGVANNTVLTVLDLLKATDALAVEGLLYNGDAVKRKEANSVYSALNDAGNIG